MYNEKLGVIVILGLFAVRFVNLKTLDFIYIQFLKM